MIKIDNQIIMQIGTGDNTRDYTDICLDFGIAIVGPGRPGNAKKNPDWDNNYWGTYLTQIKIGDIVLLRRGQYIIKAVGKVIDDYKYSESLSDVHGWDLNHYITLKWFVKDDGSDITLPHAMIGYSTMSKVDKNYDAVKEIINKENLVELKTKKNLSELKIPNKISELNINDYLINKGIRINDAFNIVNTINRIIILINWYIDNDPNVLEYELRTFVVIPFLLSLGWSEQKIKLEYNKIDIALFNETYNSREKQEPKVIIETKTFNDGLHFAENQIQTYVNKYEDCQIIVTTNGYRYNIFKKIDKEFIRYAYFNMLDMRKFDYLNNNIKGMLDGMYEISNFK